MEIRNLKTLHKIAELGSFTKAAEALGYAQSTLTFHIREIEDHYGKPVFEKAGKRKRLTAFGRQLLEQADTVLRQYEVIENLGKTDEVQRESIRIGAPESLMMYRLYPILKEFKAAYPQVCVSVVNAPCALLRGHLLSGQLDLSIMLQPVCDYPNLTIEALLEETICLVASAGHSRDDLLPDETQMVLHVEKECTYRQEFERILQSHRIAPANVLETSSVEAIKQYIMNGLGVSYLPYYAVREEAEQGLLRVRFPESELRFFTQIVTHRNKWLSPAMRAFIGLCRAYGKQWAAGESPQCPAVEGSA